VIHIRDVTCNMYACRMMTTMMALRSATSAFRNLSPRRKVTYPRAVPASGGWPSAWTSPIWRLTASYSRAALLLWPVFPCQKIDVRVV
jgi:hypothetical protein